MYPTAPFITAEVLRESFLRLEAQPDKLFCFGVTEFEFPIQRAIKIANNGDIEMFQPEHALTRSQDLEKAYHDAGQFYWGRAEGFFKSRGMFSPDAIPFLLPRYRVQDIDTVDDWERAELMFAALQERGLG
jgi:N-acylneuraminate cytidylyltransferase